MLLPSKLQKGQSFKPSVVDRINQIIDYLKSQRIVGDQKTIKVTQGNSGVMLSIPQKGGSPITSGGGEGLEAPAEGVYILVSINGAINWLQVPNDSSYVLTSKEIPSSSSSSDSSSSLSSSSSFTSDQPQYYLQWLQADECDIQCPDDTVIEYQEQENGGE